MSGWGFRVARAVFVALLVLCPGELRSSRDAVRLFEEMLKQELTRSGRGRALLFCLGCYLDVAITAIVRRSRSPVLATAQPRQARSSSAEEGSMRRFLTSLRADLVVAGRGLRKTPMATLIAVSTVGLSIALSAVVLSAARGVLFRPPPFVDADRVMAIDWIDAEFEAPDFLFYRSQQSAFERVEGYLRTRVTVRGLSEFPESLPAAYVTSMALEHLGVAPVLGTLFQEGEGEGVVVQQAVVSFDLWQLRFGGQEKVLGQTITVDGYELEIVGVMPDGFAFPVSEAIWVPIDLTHGSGPASQRSFSVFGRLARGFSPAEARAEATAIARQLEERHTASSRPTGASVEPFSRRHLPLGIRSPLFALLAAAGAVLAVACANLANLLLARSLRRSGEVALRTALGAERSRLVQQFLVEAAVVSFLGTTLGLVLSPQAVVLLRQAASSLPLPYWVEFRLDGAVVFAISLLMIVVALASGSLPAANAASCRVTRVLRAGGRGSTRSLGRAASGLVAGQIAFSVALLVAAGLLIKSITVLDHLDLGYDTSDVLTGQITLPAGEIESSDFFGTLVRQLEDLPGVEEAAIARNAPGSGQTFSWDVWIEGQERGPSPGAPRADGKNVGHGYFEALGLEIVAGRDFTTAEASFNPEAEAPRVVIVNQTFAQQHLGASAVGQRVQFGVRDPEAPWFAVVGIVEDGYVGSRNGGIGLTPTPTGQMYIPWGLAPYHSAALLLRTRSAPESAIPEVRALLAALAPGVALSEPVPLSDRIAESTWAFSLLGSVLSLFSVVALMLCAGGVYGVMAFNAAQRTPELGVRMVLGARPTVIVLSSLRDGARQLAVGLLSGSVLALFLAAGLRTMVFGVGTRDPQVYGIAVALVGFTSLFACLVPALAASRQDPLAVLRED